jgi:hypothetical protein
MKKTWIALPVAAVVALGMVACSDAGTFMAPDELDLKAAEPGTEVVATFTIEGVEQITYLTSPLIPGTGEPLTGECGTGDNLGKYRANTNQPWGPTVGYSNNCVRTTSSGELVVEFETIANYVQAARSGNIHLNFSACGYTEQEIEPEVFDWVQTSCETKTYIHYKKNSDWTEGAGVIFGRDSDDNQWTIDLSQIQLPGDTEMKDRVIGYLLAVGPSNAEYGGEDHALGAVKLDWTVDE